MGKYRRVEDPKRLKDRRVVLKVDDGVDPREVYGTTYQMRNFYKQFADGFFSSLDVMNYIQHHAAVMKMKKNNRVLDVCCGRGLLLPLIRWHRKDIKEYVGVDISEANINEQMRISGCHKIKEEETVEKYYPFDIKHVLCSCAEMDQFLDASSFDLIVYTSAIEHMQKDVGFKSLQCCAKLLKPGGSLFLSCPNTSDKQDPYDTQYAAHVYEWSLGELKAAIAEVGLKLVDTVGLVGKVREYEEWVETKGSSAAKKDYEHLSRYLPKAWLMAFFPILYPEVASEVLLIAEKDSRRRLILGI